MFVSRCLHTSHQQVLTQMETSSWLIHTYYAANDPERKKKVVSAGESSLVTLPGT